MDSAHLGGHVFEFHREMLDVTSMSRPDTSWRFTDAHNHLHAWHVNGQIAQGYRPEQRHELPTLTWVVDGTAYYPDGDPYDFGHYECATCGEAVPSPATTADICTQYMPGLAQYRIDGERVSEDVFKAEWAKATANRVTS